MIFKKISPSWFLIVAVTAILWLPNLFSLGMFVDGVADAMLAQSLYLKVSSFWQPQTYSQSFSWGTMPLSIYLLSVFYKIFGDHYFVERLYSFLCAVLQLGLIHWAWKIFFAAHEEIKKYSWLPCLLWLISPVTAWCYTNNMMENTMTLLTTSAIIVSLKYVQTQKNILTASILASAFLLLAFITKGPVSFFVFALPVLFIGINENYGWRQSIIFSLLQIFFFVIFFAVLFSFDAPNNFLHHYLEEQIKPALLHSTPTEYKPYSILIELLLAVLPFLLLAAVRVFVKEKVISANLPMRKTYWHFLLLGLCGTLPIMISNKQRQFYLLPAMVPYAIGFAIYLLPLLELVQEKINQQAKQKISILLKGASVLAIIICIFLSLTRNGKIVRDEDLLNDLKQLNELTKGEIVIRADHAFYNQWSLQTYLLRLYRQRICMPEESIETHFYLTFPNQVGSTIPIGSRKIFAGRIVDLYKI